MGIHRGPRLGGPHAAIIPFLDPILMADFITSNWTPPRGGIDRRRRSVFFSGEETRPGPIERLAQLTDLLLLSPAMQGLAGLANRRREFARLLSIRAARLYIRNRGWRAWI